MTPSERAKSNIIQHPKEREHFLERHNRLKNLFHTEPSIEKDMFFGFKLPERLYAGLRSAVKIYIYDCLNEWHTDKVFDLGLTIDDFMRVYKSDIKELPNITPNGLILPKKQLICSYNMLLKKSVELIKFLGLEKTCVSAYMPINVRVIFGEKDPALDSRPRSSTIWHSDIWAAQSAQECMLHTPITGDFIKNGISTAYPPKGFFPNYVRPLDNFSEGEEKLITDDFLENNIYDHSMIKGNVYIADSFLFHKTEKNERDCRIVLSFPLVPKGKLESDVYQTETREDDYIPLENWIKFGTERFLYTAKDLEQFVAPKDNSPTYADKFEYLKATK